jgi:hypothetical protein
MKGKEFEDFEEFKEFKKRTRNQGARRALMRKSHYSHSSLKACRAVGWSQ